MKKDTNVVIILYFNDQEILYFFKPDDEFSLWIQLIKWLKNQQKSIETINESLLLARAESIARYFISSLNGLMLDMFQLGTELTNVHDQLRTLIFSLKEMLCPIRDE